MEPERLLLIMKSMITMLIDELMTMMIDSSESHGQKSRALQVYEAKEQLLKQEN